MAPRKALLSSIGPRSILYNTILGKLMGKVKGGLSRHLRVLTAGLSFIGLCGFSSSQSECSNPDAVQSFKSQVSNILGQGDDSDPAAVLSALRVSPTGQTSDPQGLNFRCTALVSLGNSSKNLHYLLKISPDRKSFRVIPHRDPLRSATLLNCAHAQNPNDQLICSRPELLKKDAGLAGLYNRDRVMAVANDGNVEMVDLYPGNWKKERRLCGSDIGCTNNFYLKYEWMHKFSLGDIPRWQIYAVIGVLGWVLLAAYCVPLIIAFARRHPKRWRIALLNLLAGWTVIGWLGAAIWSLRKPRA
jgi:hypothetical protein